MKDKTVLLDILENPEEICRSISCGRCPLSIHHNSKANKILESLNIDTFGIAYSCVGIILTDTRLTTENVTHGKLVATTMLLNEAYSQEDFEQAVIQYVL